MNLIEDLKILDFTTLLPGPYSTFLLTTMGAKVMRVSAPGKSDMVLESGPRNSQGVTANRLWLTDGKEETVLDLKTEEGVKEVLRLIEEEGYNCIFEQFRPGVMEKFGLGYNQLKEKYPHIIYVSITGYGQSGPLRDRAGHDINYLSLSGIMSYSGRREEGPVLYGTQIADLSAAQNAAMGALAAHSSRKDTGKGAWVDVSMLDSVIPFNTMAGESALMNGENPKREDQWLNGGSLYDFYETKDGKYMSVGSLEPKFWKNFCTAMGHEDWIEAGCVCRDFREKKEILREDFLKEDRAYWTDKFKDIDACVEPVLSVTEALVGNENCKERQALKEVDGGTIYANPVKFIF